MIHAAAGNPLAIGRERAERRWAGVQEGFWATASARPVTRAAAKANRTYRSLGFHLATQAAFYPEGKSFDAATGRR